MHSYPVSLSLVALFVPLMGLAACGGASSTAASPSAQATDKYPIVLRRDLEPGKSYRLQIKDESKEHSVTSFAGKVVEDKNTTRLFSFVGSQKALSGKSTGPSFRPSARHCPRCRRPGGRAIRSIILSWHAWSGKDFTLRRRPIRSRCFAALRSI